MSYSKSEKTSPAPSVAILSASPSTLTVCSPSCPRDADLEKDSSGYELDQAEAALAHYVVPVLEKGVKTALEKPTSPWVRFRVWYNPYRMVCPFIVRTRRYVLSQLLHSSLLSHSR